MDERLKNRLVGAAVIVSLGVIFIPMVLDNAGTGDGGIVASNIPPKPASQFSSRVVPVGEPASRIEDEPLSPATVEAEGIYGAVAEAAGERPPVPPVAASPEGARSPVPSVPAEAPEDAVPGGADGVTAWAVQLGSFSNAQNAIALRDRLRSLGYTAFVESAPDDQRNMTRVFVGPELLRSEALQVLEKLRSETSLRGIVVRYPAG